MTAAEIDEMVQRLTSRSGRNERPISAYEQGGVFLSYSVTGWDRPGSGGKFMAWEQTWSSRFSDEFFGALCIWSFKKLISVEEL